VYTFTDGYGGDVDTGMDVNLHREAHDLNSGQHSAIQFGSYNYALINFNLTSLPENAVIQQATLYLGTTGGGSANVYSVAPANAGWIEGTGDFKLALRGEPCWDALAADGQGGILTPWAGGMNGAGVVGVDIGSSPIAVLSASGAGVHALSLNVTALQDWVGANNVNAGILIKPTISNSNHIALAEHPTANLRPKLVVEYLVPSNANAVVESPLTASGEFYLNINIKINHQRRSLAMLE
jgi:hypothetical protein